MFLNLMKNSILFLKNEFIDNALIAFHAASCDYMKCIFLLNYKIVIIMLKNSTENE